MTSQEFVLWLKGFTEGVHEFNVSPKQWETLKEKLAEVKDEEKFVGRGAPTSPFMPAPNPMWQEPHYTNPADRYKITCTPGSASYTNIAGPNTVLLCKQINGGTTGQEFTKQLLKDSYNYTLKTKDGKLQ